MFKLGNFTIAEILLGVGEQNNQVLFTAVDKGGRERKLIAAMDGSQKENEVYGLAGRALVSAEWMAENVLEVKVRLVETCYEVQMKFTFEGERISTEKGSSRSFMPDRKDLAVFVKI